MRDTTEKLTTAKSFDESNIEPIASKNYGKDIMNRMDTSAAGQKKQRRANDGKFESIRSVAMYGGEAPAGKADGGRVNERKIGGRKAGGVEAAFYNNAVGGTNHEMEEDKEPDNNWLSNEGPLMH